MEELYRIVPDMYAEPIRARLCYDKLCEVRIINGAPVRVCYDGAYHYLCSSGITRDKHSAFVAGVREAEGVVMRACEHSLYTVTETLKRGYISVAGGLRIGVCGNGVMSDGRVKALKDFSSVNIRIPHEVKGCAAGLYAKATVGGIKNTLIISPPGAGKTTVLRDLCRLISDGGRRVMLCDEKYELASAVGGAPTLDVGVCTDIMSGVDKRSAFEAAVAHMNPEVIIVDEIFGADLDCVQQASTCGIAVIATVHANDRDDLKRKREWAYALETELFSVYAVLTGSPMRSVDVYGGAQN